MSYDGQARAFNAMVFVSPRFTASLRAAQWYARRVDTAIAINRRRFDLGHQPSSKLEYVEELLTDWYWVLSLQPNGIDECNRLVFGAVL